METETTSELKTPIDRDKHLRPDLDKFDRALTDGHLKQARKIHARLKGSANKFTPHLRNEFRKLNARLKELEDWQVFATSPKRQALCDRMQALAGAKDHPEQKMREIKQLHQEWKSLGSSSSRDAQKLWARFKAAGDRAYAACSEYFEHRDAKRRENQVRREEICSNLEAFIEDVNWASVDYRQLNELINRSHRDWHHHSDVPNRQHRVLNDRFFAAVNPLQQRLDEHQKQNHDRKQQLITQLQAAMDNLDTTALVQESKKLQAEWKQVGLTQRQTDQKLWKTFRRLCDQVFATRNEEQAQQKRDQKNTFAEAKSICDRLSKNPGITAADLQSCRSAYFALTQPPLKREFDALVKKASAAIAAREEDAIIEEIKRKAALCGLVEDRTYDADQAVAAWSSSVALPGAIEKQLLERRDGNTILTPEDTLAAAERLCVQLEMLAGIELQESAEVKMQLQVEQLQKGLGEGIREQRSRKQQFRDLQTAFYCLPVPGNSRFIERFHTAEETILAR